MPLSAFETKVRDMYVDGYKYREIAEATQRPDHAVKNALRTMRTKGMNELRRYGTAAYHRLDHEPDVDGDIEKGLRCHNCWILFPADCTPGKCMARVSPLTEHLPGLAAMFERMWEVAE